MATESDTEPPMPTREPGESRRSIGRRLEAWAIEYEDYCKRRMRRNKEEESLERQRRESEAQKRSERYHRTLLEERVQHLLLEYRRAPELATEEYARKLGRKHREKLIAREKELRDAFRRFHFGDADFMTLLRKRAGNEADHVINFATREHRAMGYALIFDAEPDPKEDQDEEEDADEESIEEDIEVLGR